MKNPDSHLKQQALRLAEKAASDPQAAAELAEQGFTLGEAQELSGAEFLALLDNSNETGPPSVTITVYLSDSAGAERYAFEDSLSEVLEEHGLGEWVGGGQGNIGGDPFFDMTYAVNEIAAAIPLIHQRLKLLGAGSKARITTSDGGDFGLG